MHRFFYCENFITSICTLSKNYSAMKLIYSILLCSSILIVSCNSKKAPDRTNVPPETPKALQDDNKSSDISLVSKKRYSDDLVEELYNELLEKNSALNNLEKNIEQLKDNSRDSAITFNAFNTKNDAYYGAASAHLGNIKDSAIKQKIKLLIDNSLARYQNKIAAHKNLIASIADKDMTLDDLHVVLKLIQTMAVIEKYQNSGLPSTQPLDVISKKYDRAITVTDAASKSASGN